MSRSSRVTAPTTSSSPHVVATPAPTPASISAATRPRRPVRRATVLANIWRAVWPIWLVTLLLCLGGSFLLPWLDGRSPHLDSLLTRPDQWLVVRVFIDHSPLTLVLVAGISLLTLLAAAGALIERRWRRRQLAPFLLRRVKRLNAHTFIPAYCADVHLPRHDVTTGASADDLAAATLRRAAAQIPHGKTETAPLGLCVFGTTNQGKTRLAWEAVRATLPGWLLLRWPLEWYSALDVSLLRGKRIVLWLDDLHTYAHPFEAIALNDLPQQCAAHHVRLVIVATCRDGAAETLACEHLGSLLARLTPIRLGNITANEADQLAMALAKAGAIAHREQFDGTPGSLTLETRRLQQTCYPQLSPAAKGVLAAVKLLHSAHIYRYPAARVRALSQTLFGVADAAWADAQAELVTAGFLRSHSSAPAHAADLVFVAHAYLEQAVPDHISRNGEMSDDWPPLQDAMEQRRDTAALLRLSAAFNGMQSAVGVFLPPDVRASKVRAVMCARAALRSFTKRHEPISWSAAQLLVGDTLGHRAVIATGLPRVELLRLAGDAYEDAAATCARVGAYATWATIRWRMAQLAWQQAQDAVYAGRTQDACVWLQHARQQTDCALSYFTPSGDTVAHHAVCQLNEAIFDAMRELGCEETTL